MAAKKPNDIGKPDNPGEQGDPHRPDDVPPGPPDDLPPGPANPPEPPERRVG
jgi:hypothetical protein